MIDSETYALNLSVLRGNVEIVLEYGANPYVENDLGMNAFENCDIAGPFPSVNVYDVCINSFTLQIFLCGTTVATR